VNVVPGSRFERVSAAVTVMLALVCGVILVLGARDLDRRTERQRELLSALGAAEQEPGEPGHVAAYDGLFPGLRVRRVAGDTGLVLRLVPAASPGGQP
jgi:hypothetical protein